MAVVQDFTCPPGFEPEKLDPDDPSQITADLEDENTELWMIKAPLNFDISLLSDHELKEHFNIPLKKKSDIEFVAKATENHPMCKTLQTVFPHKTKSKLTIGPSFKGYVDIVQSVKIPKCDYPALPREKPYQIPSNLKQRYIPYGSRSPPRISSAQIVKEKSKKRKRSESLSFSMPDLDASQVSQVDHEDPPVKKKRKKHKKEKDLGGIYVDMTDDSFTILPLQTLGETPKLRELDPPNSIGEEEPTPVSGKKKKKKKKKNQDEIDGSLLEKVQDPLLNVPLQNSIVDEMMNEPVIPAIESKKKKHKRKSEDLNRSLLIDNGEQLLNVSSLQDSLIEEILNESDTLTIESKKKKHKRKSEDLNLDPLIDNGGLAIPESSYPDDHDESLTVSGKKKKKKKKHRSEREEEEEKKIENDRHNSTALGILDDSASQAPNSSKKKKKHKDEKEPEKEEKIDDDLDKMAVNILDDSASQTPNTESSKKKKKKHKREKEKEETKIEDDHYKMAINCCDDSASQTANMDSSSKKKSKKRKLSEDAIPVMNGLSMDTADELSRKDSGIGSMEMEMEICHLNSVDSVLEQSASSSHKKKKKKHKKHSLDETYLQLNIPT